MERWALQLASLLLAESLSFGVRLMTEALKEQSLRAEQGQGASVSLSLGKFRLGDTTCFGLRLCAGPVCLVIGFAYRRRNTGSILASVSSSQAVEPKKRPRKVAISSSVQLDLTQSPTSESNSSMSSPIHRRGNTVPDQP